MNGSNIKIYLAISGALIFLFILMIIIPFAKKNPTQNNKNISTNQPFPTSIEANPTPANTEGTSASSITIKAGFTGVIDEEIPSQIVDLSAQKRDLQSKTPLDLTTFSIDFDYSEDKFSVTLKDPKDQARREFESWRSTNYSGLSINQFNFK